MFSPSAARGLARLRPAAASAASALVVPFRGLSAGVATATTATAASGSGSAGAGSASRRAGYIASAAAAAAVAAVAASAARGHSFGLGQPAHAQAAELLSSPRAAFKPPFEEQYPGALAELLRAVGEDRLSLDEDELEQRGKEVSGYATPSNPQVVVWPDTTEHVSDVLKIANKHKIPVVPYAAGTSVEGHTVATQGGITLDIKNMCKVLQVNVEDMDCVVQPGVGWMQLNDHCAEYGMFLGVDPAPGACIGGMCATCCSGTNAVRYGTMKDQVLNLTIVLADGTVLKTGQRARKSSAGYDLARLFVGSEGTLGIVTEATLRLRNVPEHVVVARVTFPSVHAACSAVIKILQKGVQLGAIEIMDEVMVKAVNQYSALGLPEMPTILFKFAGTPAHVADDINVVKDITGQFTKESYHFAETKEETNELWGARKHAFWAAQTFEDGKELMATDVAVPISKLADCIMETKKELDASFLFCPIVGHVGDGNFHTCIAFDPNDPKENAEAHRLNHLMVHRAIRMGGTCTGEHGIGIGKKEYLVPELGEEAVNLMKVIKKALDKNLILNPNKIIDFD
jgi:D-lactate dehydrogenase (cytochrome)